MINYENIDANLKLETGSVEEYTFECINIGDKVIDDITDLHGTVVGEYYGIAGEHIMEVQPPYQDIEPVWIARSRLKLQQV